MDRLLLATPALWFPGQSEEEWQSELEAMQDRAEITAAFLRGEIETDSFLDYLAEEYANPLEVAESWELDQCLTST